MEQSNTIISDSNWSIFLHFHKLTLIQWTSESRSPKQSIAWSRITHLWGWELWSFMVIPSNDHSHSNSPFRRCSTLLQRYSASFTEALHKLWKKKREMNTRHKF